MKLVNQIDILVNCICNLSNMMFRTIILVDISTTLYSIVASIEINDTLQNIFQRYNFPLRHLSETIYHRHHIHGTYLDHGITSCVVVEGGHT